MNAIKDLLGSERGFLGLILLAGATVLAALGHMPVAQWQEFSLYVFGVYTVGKTVTGAVQIAKGYPAEPAAPAPAPAPVEPPQPPADPELEVGTSTGSTTITMRRPRARKPKVMP